eukprot:4665256-Prymnesium_polylepis.1
MSIGDIASGAAPTNPILPDGTCVADAPTVQGTPVFYSADELRDALAGPMVMMMTLCDHALRTALRGLQSH